MKLKLDYKWMVLSVTTVAALWPPSIQASLSSDCRQFCKVYTQVLCTASGSSPVLPDDEILAVILEGCGLLGRVRLYNLGFAIFTVGSLFCAISRNGEQLVLARLLQGSGAALLSVNSIAIITDAFPKDNSAWAGTNIMAMNLGAISGYTLGGIMITALGWQSIFLINVPIGIFGTIWGLSA